MIAEPATAPPAASNGLTRAEVAAALDVPPARITQWVADGMPVMSRGRRGQGGRYDVDACRAWREARQSDIGSALSLEEERAKLTRAQGELATIKIAREMGALLPREMVVAEGRRYITAVAAKLRGLAPRLIRAGLITFAQTTIVEDLVEEIIAEMAGWTATLDELAEDVDLDEAMGS